MKKASSRSQRGSKGIKGKHVLQICVLLGVCIWLIYQVKYSHDKKKEFYETDSKKPTVLSEREDGLVKLGRKDLLPGYHNQNENEKHVEEDEDEEEKESKSKVENEEEDEVAEEDEEDKNKEGEEVVEEDEEENKHEEDEIDEQDQSKTDKDDELVEEETESGSNENDEKEKETNHADEIDEAREEHYKADDASSAVSHESRMLNTEKLKESSGNSTGTVQENNSNATISEVGVQKEPVLKLGEAERGDSVEKTTTEVKDGDSESSNSGTKSVVVNGHSTEVILEASGYLQNETEIMRERSQEHDKTEDGAPPSGSFGLQTVVELEQTRNESDPNITVSANITNKDSIQDVSSNSTSESSLTENISGSNTTEVKENSVSEGDDIQDMSSNSTSESSLTGNISGSNTTEVKENSRSEGDDETGEKVSSNFFPTEQTEEADDTPENTMLQEEREALTDTQTLPDIRIEGNEEDEEEVITAA